MSNLVSFAFEDNLVRSRREAGAQGRKNHHISACHDIGSLCSLKQLPKITSFCHFYLINRFIFLRMGLYFPSDETKCFFG